MINADNLEERFKKEVLSRIQPRPEPQLPEDWLHIEMLERLGVLQFAGVQRGMNVVEIGCGAHALTTVPLAFLVGETGRVVAVDRARWSHFDEIVRESGLRRRVIPLKCDARELPFPLESFDLAVLVHGVRSLKSEDIIVGVFREMLRVSERVFIAESLSIAKTKAQEAHIEMYNLRQEVFEALFGEKDDLHYFPLERLLEFVREAGGEIRDYGVFEPNLPHFLAYIPREYVERIRNARRREELLERWERAYEKLQRYGEEHPPVGWLIASKSGGGS